MKTQFNLYDEDFGHSSKGGYKRCYESHKPLGLGGGIQVFGGSCSNPIITDADIYVGLDMSHRESSKAYPWEAGESFLYYIQDMHAPADKESFIQLIDWLAVQLTANKKVHIGCIGGHGRTGTVLAALVNVMTGTKDAIRFVRENYCIKAVESDSQVDFLCSTFGITKITPAKVAHLPKQSRVTSARSMANDLSKPLRKPEGPPSEVAKVTPLRSGLSIWGQSVLFDK